MANRITQEVAEVHVVSDSQSARITQEAVEAHITPTTQNARITQLVVEVWVSEHDQLGGIIKMSDRTITKHENTVWLRSAAGFDAFVWGGKCMRIEDIAKPRGAVNPAYCLNPRDGGVELSRTLKGLAGLPTTSLAMKETQYDTVADALESCLWTLDRRTHCKDFDKWDAWEKIRRVCHAAITDRTDMGSDFESDDSEAMTTMAVTGEDVITIRHVSVTIDQTLEQGLTPPAAQFNAISVCHGERCGSRCDSENQCVIAVVTGVVSGGEAHLIVNNRGGAHGYWTDHSLASLTTDAAIDVLCLGDYVIVVSEASTDPQFIISLDGGTSQIDITGNADMTTGSHEVLTIDGITQAFLVAAGNDGYVYASSDGGYNWETVDAGVATSEDLVKIKICRADTSIIYAIGDNNAFVKSTNGGQNFFALTGPSAGDNLTSLYVYNENHLLVGNDDGEIWETDDGGETWTQQTTPYGFTPAAGTTIIKDFAGCGCDVVWMIVEDTSTTSFLTDSEQRLYRNVDNGADGRWFLEENADFNSGIARLQRPKAVACCGPNRAIVVGGEETGTASGFVAIAA